MDPLPRLTLAIYQRMLAYTYQHNDLDRLTTVVARLIKINPDQAEIYERILAYIAQYHRMPVLNLK
jgi:regulator of sirC expression with transglutaminase-like and TPR domain